MPNEHAPISKFVSIDGRWIFDGTKATYEGPAPHDGPGEQQRSDGMCLAEKRFRSGTIKVRAIIENPACAARLVFGYNARTRAHYTLGINGWYRAYVLAGSSGASSQLLRAEGPSSVLTPGEKQIEISVSGQRVSLFIDSVCVLEDILPLPIEGDQVGLYVWGNWKVSFEDLVIDAAPQKSFVVMQFGEPYDTFWKEVIMPVAEDAGFTPIRADDIYGPGVILRDIIQQIEGCDVVIAEITPSNANVFYELGYAHARGKPAILLANKNERDKLPFDIRGYRVVYYSDTIGGKSEIEAALAKHLDAIRLGQGPG